MAKRRRRTYTDLLERAGHLGRLVLPVMSEKLVTEEDVMKKLHLRREQFILFMTGTQRSLAISVSQVIGLASLLGLDPVLLLEAYTLDSSKGLYHEMYWLFRWYRAILTGETRRERKSLGDLATLLYLYEVYTHVKGQSGELYKVFLGNLHAFMESTVPSTPLSLPSSLSGGRVVFQHDPEVLCLHALLAPLAKDDYLALLGKLKGMVGEAPVQVTEHWEAQTQEVSIDMKGDVPSEVIVLFRSCERTLSCQVQVELI